MQADAVVVGRVVALEDKDMAIGGVNYRVAVVQVTEALKGAIGRIFLVEDDTLGNIGSFRGLAIRSGAWTADPWVAYHNYYAPQGIGADLIATLEGFSRADVDAFALRSHQRAAAARAEGRFAKSIVPVRDMQRRYAAWALKKLGGRKMLTCEKLGIDSKTLAKWLAVDQD